MSGGVCVEMLITVMIVLKVLEGTRGGNWDNVFQREGEERLDVRSHSLQPFSQQSLDAP